MKKSIENKFYEAQSQLKEFAELYNAICFLSPQGEYAKQYVIEEIIDRASKLRGCIKLIMNEMIKKVGEDER